MNLNNDSGNSNTNIGSRHYPQVLKNHTAGDPMDETIRWTNLTHQEIAEKLGEEYEIQVSQPVIGQLLKSRF